jgi:hypothetical protein
VILAASIGPSPTGALTNPVGPSLSGVNIFELVLAGLLILIGVRSLMKWLRVRFPARSTGEGFLYSLNVTARVGLWFAFAAFLLGEALVEKPDELRWFALVPIALAGVQLLTTLALGREGRS